MVAYAEYYTDARIKSYVNALSDNNVTTSLYCLNDKHTAGSEDKNLRTIFVQKKYQGKNRLVYLLSYMLFFIKAFFIVSIHSFTKKYDVYHVHNIPDLIVFCALIPKLFGKKIILDMHDVMTATFESKFSVSRKNIFVKLIKYQTIISLKFSDVLICTNHSHLKYLEEIGIRHKNTILFLNLPHEKYFFTRKENPINDTFNLIYHGTITKRLGLDLIIKAVEIASVNNKVTFTMIGEGELKKELVNYCIEKKLLDKVIFIKSFIPVEELQNEIEKYDAGIVGNRKSELTDKIMLPVKMIEYMAVGLPVIVPRLKVIEYYFSDNMVMYFEPDNVKDLAEKITTLSSDKNMKLNYIKNSTRFFEKYNWKKQEEDYIKLISETIS